MVYDNFEAEIAEAIFTGKNKDIIIKQILEEEHSLPLELIKLGYNQSFYRYDAKGKRIFERTGAFQTTNRDSKWIHMLAYCENKGVEEYIEEILVSEQRHQGDCLLALWSKNQKKALKWLKLMHKFDPQFIRLHFTESTFTTKLCAYYSCQKTDLFNMLLLKEHKQKGEIIQNSIQKALLTRKEFFERPIEERRGKEKEIHDAFEERRKLIESGTLSPEQADKIFDALWTGQIDMQSPSSDYVERDPCKVFITIKTEDNPVSYRFFEEVPQFLDLIPQLSSASDKKITSLYTYLPFWLEHYWSIEESMFNINPKQVIKDWKELILIDFNHGTPTNASGHSIDWLVIGKESRRYHAQSGHSGRPTSKIIWITRPTPEEIIKGLNRLKELEDKDLLLTIMNHYDEQVRVEVQKHLKEII